MSQTSFQSRDQVTEHLEILRKFARKPLVVSQPLSRLETVDKTNRLKEFRSIRKSFQLTGSEMTRLIFRGLFRAPRSCGCPTCQACRVDRYDDTLGNDGPRSPLSGQKGPHA